MKFSFPHFLHSFLSFAQQIEKAEGLWFMDLLCNSIDSLASDKHVLFIINNLLVDSNSNSLCLTCDRSSEINEWEWNFSFLWEFLMGFPYRFDLFVTNSGSVEEGNILKGNFSTILG